MPDELTSAQELDAALREVVREQIARADETIQRREQELSELRKTRERMERILTTLDPPKPALAPASQRVAKIDAWLREHVQNGATFSVPELMADGYGLTSPETLRKSLDLLVEQGRIRLESIGSGYRGGQGQKRKNYVLVQ